MIVPAPPTAMRHGTELRRHEAGDETLLAALRGPGSAEAFEALYRRHFRAVARGVERRCGDASLAEEAAQDAFVRLWNAAHSLDLSTLRVRPWLLTVATHAATDRLRRKRRPSIPLDDACGVAGRDPKPHELAEARETASEMRAALARLPGRQREALELSYYGGLSQSEVATRLREPLGTIKSRCRLGLGRLREALGSDPRGAFEPA